MNDISLTNFPSEAIFANGYCSRVWGKVTKVRDWVHFCTCLMGNTRVHVGHSQILNAISFSKTIVLIKPHLKKGHFCTYKAVHYYVVIHVHCAIVYTGYCKYDS